MRAFIVLLLSIVAASCGGGSSDDAVPPPDHYVIDMQNGVLHGVGWMASDPGGFVPYALTKAASSGETVIEANVPVGLLVVLQGTDGEYRTTVVTATNATTVSVSPALAADVPIGSVDNFYFNTGHPNQIGYFAVADYALRSVGALPGFSTGTIVLLGDSWFAQVGIADRLRARLPNANIINAGVGGNTSADLIARFATDVTPKHPNFVLILAGSNDFAFNVPVATYAANIFSLIAMTKALGAVPIVFNSAVCSTVVLGAACHDLSLQYASAVH